MDNRAFSFLIGEWVKSLESKAVCDYRKPVIGNFTNLLIEANEQSSPITFVGISCQPRIKTPGSNSDTDRIIPLIDTSLKRHKKFIAEISYFFSALKSFGLQYIFQYSVSDIETKTHVVLQNMGQTIQNNDAFQNIITNQSLLVKMLREAGVNVQEFSETDILMREMRANSLHELQEKIAGKNPSCFQFLDALYDLGQTIILPNLATDNLAAWLDVQTFTNENLVKDFESKSQQLAPKVPLISVIKNCSNWNSRDLSANTFLTKQELFAGICGFDSRDKQQIPTTKESWIRKLIKLNAKKLEELWQLISEEIVISESIETASKIANRIVQSIEL